MTQLVRNDYPSHAHFACPVGACHLSTSEFCVDKYIYIYIYTSAGTNSQGALSSVLIRVY